MTTRKRALAATAAVAITSNVLIGATATASAAGDDPTNTDQTAMRLCVAGAAHDDYDTVYVEKKESLTEWDPGSVTAPDPDIGTLYVVHLADPDHNTRHCAIVIKGGKTDGAHHLMGLNLSSPDPDDEDRDVEGYREQQIGPQYVGHHWNHAFGDIFYGGGHYLAELYG